MRADDQAGPGEEKTVREDVGVEIEDAVDEERESSCRSSKENTLASARSAFLSLALARPPDGRKNEPSKNNEPRGSWLAGELGEIAFGKLGPCLIGIGPVGWTGGGVGTAAGSHDGRSQGKAEGIGPEPRAKLHRDILGALSDGADAVENAARGGTSKSSTTAAPQTAGTAVRHFLPFKASQAAPAEHARATQEDGNALAAAEEVC